MGRGSGSGSGGGAGGGGGGTGGSEAILVEPYTFAVEKYSDSFFSKHATDRRFQLVEFHKFYPTNAIDGSPSINFFLPPWQGANLYMINDLLMEVTCKIVKADGSPIVADRNVAPANNVMHSIFSSVRISLNDFTLNNNSEFYPYRAYLHNLLSNDQQCKCSHMQSEGYYEDITNFYNSFDENNIGIQERKALFAESKEARFVGRVQHDLQSAKNGIIPGVAIKIQLMLSQHAFSIQCDEDIANKKYKMKITSCVLHCPVATLDSAVFGQIERTLKNKPISLYFTRSEVTTHAIPALCKNYLGSALFPQNVMPCRSFLVFVPTDIFAGVYSKNPFEFRRKWRKPAANRVAGAAAALLGSADEVCFIKSVQIKINGGSDSLHAESSEHECMMDFARLNYYMEYMSTDKTNSITYEDFKNNSYVCVFDFSTSGQCGMDLLIPAVRLGHARLEVTFSQATFTELTVVVLSEYPSILTINSDRKLNASYL
jgi:hypothetical protein